MGFAVVIISMNELCFNLLEWSRLLKDLVAILSHLLTKKHLEEVESKILEEL